MNIAVILAGGTGSRMKLKNIPKQFLKINKKPILIHTLENFNNNSNIDAIIISCIESWIPFCKRIVRKFNIYKVISIVPGGETGQLSIYNGLKAAINISQNDNDIVLIHDGVRPIIDENLIDRNILSVKKYGSAITCVEAKETVALINNNQIITIERRDNYRIAKAPQSFYLSELLAVHHQALRDGHKNFTDSCTLMHAYGKELHLVEGRSDNIKITTPEDIFVFKMILKQKKNNS